LKAAPETGGVAGTRHTVLPGAGSPARSAGISKGGATDGE